MDSEKELEMEKPLVTSPTTNSTESDTLSHSPGGHRGHLAAQELMSIERMLEGRGNPTGAVPDAETNEVSSNVAEVILNGRGVSAKYVKIAGSISAQFNEARKGKKTCETSGKLEYGIYLAGAVDPNILTKIGNNSTEGTFLKVSGSMCRAIVRGKDRGTNDDDGAANITKHGTVLSDLGDKKSTRRNDNDYGSSRNELRTLAPKTVHCFEGKGMRLTSGSRQYSPLQKWEYLNGMPVDGVQDVRRWAIDVGLEDDDVENNDDDDMPMKKKFKGQNFTEPPKYGTSANRMILSSAEEQQLSTDDTYESDSEVDEEPNTEDKMKDKM